MAINKVFPNVDAAVEDIRDGAVIAFSGFFSAGRPAELTKALARKKVKDLTIVVQSVGVGNEEIVDLVINGQVKKAICNYPFQRSATKGLEHPFEKAVRAGQIEIEVYPMGTFIEKLRCAGAGIPAFYTPVGYGTVVAEGKETKTFNGIDTILETALPVDYAFVHAMKGDREGNLIYHATAQNYNLAMAMAGKVTIAEVETLVDTGKIDPDYIHTQGVYVKRIVETGKPAFCQVNI